MTTPHAVQDLPLYLAPEARLDLFSTSQKDVLFCAYSAPYFAYKIEGKTWGITQGNCHHWDCPKCGEGRAKHEYGRIVEGCRTLESDNNLYFITLTCKGKHLKLADAMKGYLEWTNRLFSALRADAKKRNLLWSYVQVTEQQGRGHPHSHILTTYVPADLTNGYKRSYHRDENGLRSFVQKSVLRSEYLSKRVISAGLGEQYDISRVDKVEGASRYVAKYLFHPDMFKAKYPKGWKRVRYSQSFPDLSATKHDCICLLSRENWALLSREAVVVRCSDERCRQETIYQLKGSDCIITVKQQKDIVDNTII